MATSHSDEQRRPILFVSMPDAGLLNPLLVLAGELARRGVPDLWFATDEHRRDEVAKLTDISVVRFESLGPPEPGLTTATWDDDDYRDATQASAFKCTRTAMRQSYQADTGKRAAIDAVVDRVRPALMVIDCLYRFAIDVAERRNVPFVLGSPFVASNLLTAHLPFAKSYTPRGFPAANSGLSASRSPWRRLKNLAFKIRCLQLGFDPVLGKAFKEHAQWRNAAGLPPATEKGRVDAARLIVNYSIAELDYPLTVPEKVKLVGAMLPPLPENPNGDPVTDWLDRQSSVVYVGFGTITRLTHREVAALVEVARMLQDRHQVLWKLPAEQQHLLPARESLPGNLRIESWVPSQLDVLAHPSVRAFLSHGGGNGYHEAVYFGKSQVVWPLWIDCHDQAVRVQDLGIGLRLDRRRPLDATEVAGKLTRVIEEPSFSQRAQRLGELQRAAGGRVAAADVLLGMPELALTRPLAPPSPAG
jgi:polyene glycosyltransferase